jgi:predicted anti-sigma-YlaC factor YlaD
MSCEAFHELISADLDGEADEHEQAVLAAHLETCARCRAFVADATALHRATRIAPASTVPDLTDVILERAAADPSIGRRRIRRRNGPAHGAPRSRVAVLAFQYGLLVVALMMMVLALPELFASSGEGVHVSRHLGGWDVAFAVGLLIAALQPWRARGLLPMAAALAGVMVVTAAIDVVRGSTAGLAEGTHLLEVFGLVFLWLLSGSLSAGERPRRGQPVPSDGATSAPVTGLRALPSRFGLTPRLSPSASERGRARPAAERRVA